MLAEGKLKSTKPVFIARPPFLPFVPGASKYPEPLPTGRGPQASPPRAEPCFLSRVPLSKSGFQFFTWKVPFEAYRPSSPSLLLCILPTFSCYPGAPAELESLARVNSPTFKGQGQCSDDSLAAPTCSRSLRERMGLPLCPPPPSIGWAQRRGT